MPGTTPILTAYIDAGRPGATRSLLRALSSNDLASVNLALAAGDVYSLRLFFRAFDADDTGDPVQWASGYAIDAVLTIDSTLKDESPVQAASVAAFAEGTPTEDGDYPYTGTLDLRGSAVAAAIGANKSVLAVLDVRVSVGSQRNTYRIPVDLYRAADGAITAPSGSTAIINHTAAQIRQTPEGVFQFYDFGLETWVQPVLRNGVMEYVEVE